MRHWAKHEGPRRGYQAVWLPRGKRYRTKHRQFGLQCTACGRWGWAVVMLGSRWWCHIQPSGWVHEGNDCPNCGHLTFGADLDDNPTNRGR